MINAIEKVHYTAHAHTTGGREGESRSSDGRLDLKLSVPGSGGLGTNPEQLLAVGWSACFLSAMGKAAKAAHIVLPRQAAVDAEIDLGSAGDAYFLAARLDVHLPGLERDEAEAVVRLAHLNCPYSKATRHNIDVTINIVVPLPKTSLDCW